MKENTGEISTPIATDIAELEQNGDTSLLDQEQLLHELSEWLGGALDGEQLAEVYNAYMPNEIVYEGDSLWRRKPE